MLLNQRYFSVKKMKYKEKYAEIVGRNNLQQNVKLQSNYSLTIINKLNDYYTKVLPKYIPKLYVSN